VFYKKQKDISFIFSLIETITRAEGGMPSALVRIWREEM
jgi:hypothetical protein